MVLTLRAAKSELRSSTWIVEFGLLVAFGEVDWGFGGPGGLLWQRSARTYKRNAGFV